MPLTAGSLFSGVGMFDLAFALAGYDILFQVEIDTYCQKVLAKHAPTYWPHSTIYADVCHIGSHNLPAVDVLFGGFPCQDISVSGHGIGIQEGSRSGLWYEFKRVIGELRPRAVMLENVAAILRSEGIKVISDLTALGYDCRWGIVSAQDIGAPHLRERWWCIALSNTTNQGIDRGDGQQGTDDARCRERTLDSGVRSHDGDEVGSPNGIGGCRQKDPRESQSNKQWDIEARGKGRIDKPNSVVSGNGEMEHTHGERCEECRTPARAISPANVSRWAIAGGSAAGHDEIESRMGGIADGTPARLDGSTLMSHVFPVGPDRPQPEHEAPRMAVGDKNTNARLKALGNGGLPQIVYPIALELKALLEGRE